MDSKKAPRTKKRIGLIISIDSVQLLNSMVAESGESASEVIEKAIALEHRFRNNGIFPLLPEQKDSD